MKAAALRYGWDLDYREIALVWRSGCIIRSVLLDRISTAFAKNPVLKSIILDRNFKEIIVGCEQPLRETIAEAVKIGIPVPSFVSAIAFYDGYRCERLGANLIQAQRDFFGAHTYERIDRPRGEFFHTNWTGYGGATPSGSYSARTIRLWNYSKLLVCGTGEEIMISAPWGRGPGVSNTIVVFTLPRGKKSPVTRSHLGSRRLVRVSKMWFVTVS